MECESELPNQKENFSTTFLSIYEEMKQRFKDRGMHTTIQTLEKCQSMILVFLEKKRPIKPYELVDTLLFNPAFSCCKDAKRMVFYVMEKLLKIGMLEKVEHNGKKGFYRLANSYGRGVSVPSSKGISQITDPRVKPLLSAWKKIFELRNLIKLWNIPSLAHSIIYEISSLLGYIETLKNESNEEGRARLDTIEKDAQALIEEYSNFARTNQLSKREAELFHSCEKGIRNFSKRIWWEY